MAQDIDVDSKKEMQSRVYQSVTYSEFADTIQRFGGEDDEKSTDILFYCSHKYNV